MGIKKKGKKDSNLTYKYPKGNTPKNKGKGRIDSKCLYCFEKISVLISQKTKFCSKKCGYQGLRYTDDKLNYAVIHARIREKYGEPSVCEHCGTTESKKFEWANISRKYLLVREDWARLCCRCHRRYDFGVKNKIETLCV